MVRQGDIVHWPPDVTYLTPAGRRVVTDVTGDPDGRGQQYAVLRREVDEDLADPEVVDVGSLRVIGRPDHGPFELHVGGEAQ